MPRVVYLNGEFVPENEARLSIYDSALMFGDMVFEMTRSFNKEHFKLEEHIDRLLQGARALHIEIGKSKAQLLEICHETSRLNSSEISEGDEHRLMINVSRGPLGIYKHMFDDPQPTVVVADFPLSWTIKSMAPLLLHGIDLWVPPQMAIPEHLMDPKIKNRSRLFYQMANIQVSYLSNNERVWALLIDPDGFICEGTGSNFFMVKNGVLFTPEPRNILRGISRQFIIDLARSLELEVVEKNITIFDAQDADEAFMTGTPFSMLPVSSINGLKLASQKNEKYAFGPISSRLVSAWEDSVNCKFTDQLLGFSSDSPASGSSPYKFSK